MENLRVRTAKRLVRDKRKLCVLDVGNNECVMGIYVFNYVYGECMRMYDKTQSSCNGCGQVSKALIVSLCMTYI